MRKTLAVAVLLAIPAVGALAPAASAYCDPKYYPLCTNDCQMEPRPIDPRDPFGSLIRMCPE